MNPRPTSFWPTGDWIPIKPAFLKAPESAKTSGMFIAPKPGALFLLSRWANQVQGSVSVNDLATFRGLGLFELAVKPDDGPLLIQWTLTGPIDSTRGSGFVETFQTAAWYVPLEDKENVSPKSKNQNPLSTALTLYSKPLSLVGNQTLPAPITLPSPQPLGVNTSGFTDHFGVYRAYTSFFYLKGKPSSFHF
jgi:hypothetical protein